MVACKEILGGFACGYLVPEYEFAMGYNSLGEVITYGRMPGAAEILSNIHRLKGVILTEETPLSHSHVILSEFAIPLYLCKSVSPLKRLDYIAMEKGVLSLGGSAKERKAKSAQGEVYTADGVKISLLGTAWNLDDIRKNAREDNFGTGLFRTEGIAEKMITKAEQKRIYEKAEKFAGGGELGFRFFDFEGDKLCFSPKYRAFAEEDQLCAFAETLHRARVIVPNAESKNEIADIKEKIAKKRALFSPRISVGAMIETKKGAEFAEQIAAKSDFIYIGLGGLTREIGELEAIKSAADICAAAAIFGRQITACGASKNDDKTIEALVAAGVRRFAVSRMAAKDMAEIISKSRAKEPAKIFQGVFYSSYGVSLNIRGESIGNGGSPELKLIKQS